MHHKHAPRKGLQVMANWARLHLIPYVQIIQKVAFLPFWSPKIRGKHFLGLTKRRFLGLLGICEGKRKGQKVEGCSACLPEYLPASTPERTDKHQRQQEGANLAPPGYGEEEGGGVTPYITRGTKTGNKVLSLWKGGKRKWEKKKD